MNKRTHKIFLFVVRLLVRLIARVEKSGFENLPRSGGFVIAANHVGRLDAAMNADIHTIRESLRRLQQGGIFVITPEGTRSKSGNLIEGKPGAIYLAWKAGVPVLPVALTGSEDAVVLDRLKHFKRLRIKATAGEFFTLPPEVKGRDRDAIMQKYTDEVMCRIAMLLPEERRGAYAQHPRLKELLGQ
jgi:1-acyl-sn-glycerol-3-phosphate acyltransferase